MRFLTSIRSHALIGIGTFLVCYLSSVLAEPIVKNFQLNPEMYPDGSVCEECPLGHGMANWVWDFTHPDSMNWYVEHDGTMAGENKEARLLDLERNILATTTYKISPRHSFFKDFGHPLPEVEKGSLTADTGWIYREVGSFWNRKYYRQRVWWKGVLEWALRGQYHYIIPAVIDPLSWTGFPDAEIGYFKLNSGRGPFVDTPVRAKAEVDGPQYWTPLNVPSKELTIGGNSSDARRIEVFQKIYRITRTIELQTYHRGTWHTVDSESLQGQVFNVGLDEFHVLTWKMCP